LLFVLPENAFSHFLTVCFFGSRPRCCAFSPRSLTTRFLFFFPTRHITETPFFPVFLSSAVFGRPLFPPHQSLYQWVAVILPCFSVVIREYTVCFQYSGRPPWSSWHRLFSEPFRFGLFSRLDVLTSCGLICLVIFCFWGFFVELARCFPFHSLSAVDFVFLSVCGCLRDFTSTLFFTADLFPSRSPPSTPYDHNGGWGFYLTVLRHFLFFSFPKPPQSPHLRLPRPHFFPCS